MNMIKFGYTTIDNIKCVVTYYSDKDSIDIIPSECDKRLPFIGINRIKNIVFYEDKYSKYIAKVSKVSSEPITGGYSGKIDFLCRLSQGKEKIQVMKITGDEIDNLFDPVIYIYKQRQSGKYDNPDLLYDNIILKEFNCHYNNITINIRVVLGEAFSMGFSSDQKIHTKLMISFSEPVDVFMAHNVSILISNCIKELRFNNDSNIRKIELFEKTNRDTLSYIGFLRNKAYSGNNDLKYREIDFQVFEKYLQNIFQQVFDDNCLDPDKDNQLYCLDIYERPTWRDIASIITAYETECKKHKEFVKDTSCYDIVKNKIKEAVKSVKCVGAEEELFKNGILSEIGTYGNSYGQRKKLLKAYELVEPALESSIDHTLYYDQNAPDKTHRIKNAVDTIIKMRNALFHGDDLMDITKYIIQCARFLQILTYALILYRAGVNYETIEIMIDQIFHCNYKYQQ